VIIGIHIAFAGKRAPLTRSAFVKHGQGAGIGLTLIRSLVDFVIVPMAVLD
jgi:hypothetical protein